MEFVVRKRVLVAPLDWGLGHATRCIPVILLLRQLGCEVFIASSGDALTLLREEFPNIQYFRLPSYKARYSTRLPLMLKVFLQIPKFVWVIFKEHRRLQQIMHSHPFDAVISDHRYGCWSAKATSIFITHQVNILMPAGFRWLEPLVNYFNHQGICRFDHCWIPDYPENPLTEKLTKPFHPCTTFVGMLSRFQPESVPLEISYQIIAVLSGPEPQREQLEILLLRELSALNHRTLVVRGLPGTGKAERVNENVMMVDHLPTQALNEAILKSELVICRSGYSSIMDLAATGSKAFFIPTPGQTEQEYLAMELMKRGVAGFQTQRQADLKVAWRERNNYKGFEDWKHRPNLLGQAMIEALR